MQRIITGLAAAVAVVVVAGCSTAADVARTAVHNVRPDVTSTAPQSGPATTQCGTPPPGGHFVGYSVQGFPPAMAPLKSLEKDTGVDADVASFYINLGTKLDTRSIMSMCAEHILPILEIDTTKASQFQQIIDGDDDSVLDNYALELGTAGIPIAIDFDHEFNGQWFAYGEDFATASEFVAAWRHVVDVFDKYHDTNIIWIWNPNVDMGGMTVANLAPWYPGNKYVTWIGLDGYFYKTTYTWENTFQVTMNQINGFTHKPFFIVETGANPASGRTRAIESLFRGAASTPDLLGLIWFDYDKATDHDWYINNDPSALSVFHTLAAKYQN